MSLYAAAARVVCEQPEVIEFVSRRLALIARRLVPPEALAAQECMLLWAPFARAAQLTQARLRLEAGRALCRDLDALGQRFDLPPLADWEDLPQGVDDPDAIDLEPDDGGASSGLTLAQVRRRLHPEMTASAAGRKAVPVPPLAGLLSELSPEARRDLFRRLLAEGVVTRSDVNLLVRWLVKGGPVGPQGAVLIEVLDRVGRWIVR